MLSLQMNRIIKPTTRKRTKKTLEHGERLRSAFGMSKIQWSKKYPAYCYDKYRDLIQGVPKAFFRNEFGEIDLSFKLPKLGERKDKDAEHKIGNTVYILEEGDLLEGIVSNLFYSATKENNLNYEISVAGKSKYRVYSRVYSKSFINKNQSKIMVNLKKLKMPQAVAILRQGTHPKLVLKEVAQFVKNRGRLIEKYEHYLDYEEVVTDSVTPEKKKKKNKKNKQKELPVTADKKKKKKGKKVLEEVEVPVKSSKPGKKKKNKKNKKEAPAPDLKEKVKKGKKVKEYKEEELKEQVEQTTAPVEEYPESYLGKAVKFTPSKRVTTDHKEVRGVIVGRHLAKDAKFYKVWVSELNRISMLRITNPSITFYKKTPPKLAEAFKATGLKIVSPRRTKAEMIAEAPAPVEENNGTKGKVKSKKKKKKNKKQKV